MPRQEEEPGLARRLGLFDATMIVMGGIIGSGIFMNPHVVAQIVHTPWLILGAWGTGGLIALMGAFIYAELASRRPEVGGQYAYLREAYHPLVAFLFGWTLFLVSNCGGMAAVAITFGRYFVVLTGSELSDTAVAISALVILAAINCLGVRAGGTVQNIFMVLKIVAIVALIACGYLFIHHNQFFTPARAGGGLPARPQGSSGGGGDVLASFGAAMVPVMFAYGGWQTANFVAGEIREPRRNLPRGLLLGVMGVVLLYVGVNVISIRALGADGLAVTSTPASEVMSIAFGPAGARLIAFGIAVSTVGFLSQSILTAPRVYYAMAQDGLFFRSAARLHPKTRVPAGAIALQGVLAVAVALSGTYEEILSYVVSNDFIFFGLTASCIFVFRRRAGNARPEDPPGARNGERFPMPGHPATTFLFILVCAAIVINTVHAYPFNTLIGIAIMITGIPVYFLWRRRIRREQQ